MKIALAIFFNCFILLGYTQERIYFNISLNPEKKYLESTIIESTIKLEVSPKSEDLDLESIGIPETKSEYTKNEFLSEIITKKRKTDNQNFFPIEINCIYFDPGVGRNILPENSIFYGLSVEKGVYQIDSMSAGNFNPQQKQEMISIFSNSFGKYHMPSGKDMKIGDTYKVNNSYEIELMGHIVVFDATNSYTLIEIKNGKALFQTNHDIILRKKASTKSQKEDSMDLEFISGKASGRGNLVYNIRNRYLDEQVINLDMIMLSENDFFQIHVDSQLTSIIRSEVTDLIE